MTHSEHIKTERKKNYRCFVKMSEKLTALIDGGLGFVHKPFIIRISMSRKYINTQCERSGKPNLDLDRVHTK